jgi:hypothetical protein
VGVLFFFPFLLILPLLLFLSYYVWNHIPSHIKYKFHAQSPIRASEDQRAMLTTLPDVQRSRALYPDTRSPCEGSSGMSTATHGYDARHTRSSRTCRGFERHGGSVCRGPPSSFLFAPPPFVFSFLTLVHVGWVCLPRAHPTFTTRMIKFISDERSAAQRRGYEVRFWACCRVLLS